MLDNLSPQQIEQAFKWLDSPVKSPPPPELENLSHLEWYLLDNLLQRLLKERQQNRLH